MIKLPQYISHKVVGALKIKDIQRLPEGDQIIPDDEEYSPFIVSVEYSNKHNPQVGGYYVKYEDGYESYSPAKAFEEGYTKL